MSMSARKITQTFNGRTEWLITGGSFFKILRSVNPVDVELYRSGGVALIASQVDSGFYQRVPFDRVVITTGALEAVSFLVAPDEGGSDTFSGVVSGTIDVTDRAARLLGVASLDRTTLDRALFGDSENGQAFIGYASLGASAGNLGQVQLWNPVASGKTLYLDKVTPQPGSAMLLTVRVDAVALTNPGTTFPKLLGGAASAGQCRNVLAGAAVGTQVMVLANANFGQIEFKPPFRIPEGQGVSLCGNTVNTALDCAMEYRER